MCNQGGGQLKLSTRRPSSGLCRSQTTSTSNARGFRRLRLAPGPRPARHRLAPQLTALRPLRRRTTGVAQKATPGVGCSLDPSPAAPSPGRLTAHGALGCSPPPPRVPRRHACPCLDALCASRARVSGTDGAATAPAVAAPPLRRARRARPAAAAAAPSSPSFPPCGVWCARARTHSARQRPHPYPPSRAHRALRAPAPTPAPLPNTPFLE